MIPVVILAGGTGTRLRDASGLTPKALVPIGGIPMILHIMRIYARYGHTNFIVALGYKQEVFKDYFCHFDLINNDITVDIGRSVSRMERNDAHGWRVTLADTGLYTFKGARLKRVEKYIQGDTFFVTYGDCLSDIDISKLLAFHQSHGKACTITGIHPTSKFGEIKHTDGQVMEIREKPEDAGCLTNGGFMVMSRKALGYFYEYPECDMEHGPLEEMAIREELMVYPHTGYWACMDTPAELNSLEEEWSREGGARWVK